MKKGKQLTSLFVLLLLVSIALYGCKGDKTPTTNTSTSDSSTSVEEPMYGGSIVVGIQQDLDSLDPHLAVAAGTEEILFNVFEGLVRSDAEGNLEPAVASEYEMDKDGKSYTFTLREGIKFHDGTLVTVDDIKYSIDRCAGKLEGQKAPLLAAFSNIKSVDITDDKTVTIYLEEADTEMISYLTSAIIPKDSEKLDNIPGTGPFQFVSYKPQQSLIVEKNKNYWKKEEPYLDQVEFKVMANSDAASLELQAGAIDIYPYMTDEQASQLQDKYHIMTGNMNLVQALFLNNNTEPFHDIKVRQAISYGLNKADINDLVAGGRGHEIGSNMYSGFTRYFMEDLNKVYPHDIEKAKTLLTEAGYPDGFDMTITVPSNYKFHVDTAQVIVEQLKAMGINAQINLVEWASWLNDVYQGRNYDATIIGLEANLSAKDVLERYESKASGNFINYSNKKYDKILKEAISTIDEEKKVTLYQDLQTMLTKDAASAFIMDPPLLVAVNPKLGGYTFYPVYVQDMSKVYFIKE